MTNRILCTLRFTDYRIAHAEAFACLAIAALDYDAEPCRENAVYLKAAARELERVEVAYSDCEPDCLMNPRETALWSAAMCSARHGTWLGLADAAITFARNVEA